MIVGGVVFLVLLMALPLAGYMAYTMYGSSSDKEDGGKAKDDDDDDDDDAGPGPRPYSGKCDMKSDEIMALGEAMNPDRGSAKKRKPIGAKRIKTLEKKCTCVNEKKGSINCDF